MNATPHTHIDAAELVRFDDGELSADDRRAVEVALATCDVCAAAAERLRRRSARLAAVLSGADWQPPADALASIRGAHAAARAAAGSNELATGPAPTQHPGRRFPWHAHRMRLAAGIAVLLIGAALLSTPAAAWLVRSATRAWEAIAGSTVAPPQEPTPAPSDEVERIYEYVPDPGVLTLRLNDDAAGVLAIEQAPGASVVLRVDGAGAPEVLLLPAEIRVASAATMSLYLALPARTTAVRVLRGSDAPIIVNRRDVDRTHVLPLQPRR